MARAVASGMFVMAVAVHINVSGLGFDRPAKMDIRALGS